MIITASYIADRSLSLCSAWALNRANFLLWGNAGESGRAAKCVGTENALLEPWDSTGYALSLSLSLSLSLFQASHCSDSMLIQGSVSNKVTNTDAANFIPRSVHGTCVADGTHQTST